MNLVAFFGKQIEDRTGSGRRHANIALAGLGHRHGKRGVLEKAPRGDAAGIDGQIEVEVRDVARARFHFDGGPGLKRIQAAIVDNLIEIEKASLGVEQRRHNVIRVLAFHEVAIQLGHAGAPGVAVGASAFEHGKIDGPAEQVALVFGIVGQLNDLASLVPIRRCAGPGIACSNEGLRLYFFAVNLGQAKDQQSQDGSQGTTEVN